MSISAKNNGFTLIEILSILSILSILIVLSVIVAPKQLMKARDAVRKGHLDSFKKAVDEYYQDSGCYPKTVPSCTNDLVLGDVVIKKSIPCDPQTKFSYAYVTDLSACPKWFQIYANLEIETDRIIEKVGCIDGCGPTCQFNYGVSSSNQRLDPYCTSYSESPPADQYVCTPGGGCEVFEDPFVSGCPNIYPDDPTCGGGGQCGPGNRCANSKGKSIPE